MRIMIYVLALTILGSVSVGYAQDAGKYADKYEGRDVVLELRGGQRIEGHVLALEDEALIMRDAQGTLEDYDLEDITTLVIADSTSAKVSPKDHETTGESDTKTITEPESNPVVCAPEDTECKRDIALGVSSRKAATEWSRSREYFLEKGNLADGRAFKRLGWVSIGLGIGALTAGAIARKRSNDSGCIALAGSGDDKEGCLYTTKAFSAGMFGVSPIMIAGGTLILLYGSKKANRAKSIMQHYEFWQERNEQKPRQFEEDKPIKTSFVPAIGREGGAVQMHMTF